jgi:hypothetical protein
MKKYKRVKIILDLDLNNKIDVRLLTIDLRDEIYNRIGMPSKLYWTLVGRESVLFIR